MGINQAICKRQITAYFHLGALGHCVSLGQSLLGAAGAAPALRLNRFDPGLDGVPTGNSSAVMMEIRHLECCGFCLSSISLNRSRAYFRARIAWSSKRRLLGGLCLMTVSIKEAGRCFSRLPGSSPQWPLWPCSEDSKGEVGMQGGKC